MALDLPTTGPGSARGAIRRLLLPTILSAVALWGCKPGIPRIDPAAPELAQYSDEEIAALRRGREEYVAKCSGCHPLHHPRAGDAAYWRRWVDAMAERSRIRPEEGDRIVRFLAALSAAGRGDAESSSSPPRSAEPVSQGPIVEAGVDLPR